MPRYACQYFTKWAAFYPIWGKNENPTFRLMNFIAAILAGIEWINMQYTLHVAIDI
jgi:hypothetical protein